MIGMAPIGCAPHYLWMYNSQNGECIEEINNMIVEYNFGMRYVVDQLNQELPESSIIFCDVFQGAMDILNNHQQYGKCLLNSVSDLLNRGLIYNR